MKKFLVLGCCVTLFWASSFLACGGSEPVCIPGSTQECTCPNGKTSSQICKTDRSGYDSCDCAAVSSETTKEAVTEAGTEPTVEAALEPVSQPEEAPALEESNQGNDASAVKEVEEEDPKEEQPEPVKEDSPEEETCTSDQFKYNKKCYSVADFCEGKLQVAGLPTFTSEDQKAMQTPYVLERNPLDQKPWFCKTLPKHYYTDKTGYRKCDNDEDGWLSLSGYLALQSTNKVLQSNARCTYKEIKVLTYKSDPQKWPQSNKAVMEQALPNTVPLVESDRNDGAGPMIEMPVYTSGQAPLPTQQANDCKSDKDCSGLDDVCYLGHCITGRRFQAKEINSTTKGCVANLDLNGNGVQDASETPQSSVPTALKPFLALGLYLELQQGTLVENYSSPNGVVNAWQITERSRTGQPGNRDALALRCQEDPQGFQPDYWRQCGLRDDQTCASSSGGNRQGLSQCWRKDIQHATPSLFKCVVFDSNKDKTKPEGHFHPDNYGLKKNYNRPNCRADRGVKGSNFEDDVLFVCGADNGQRKPSGANEVGWACVGYKSYDDKANYLAGCVSEKAEQVCGPPGGKDRVTYLLDEAGSYGLVRANRECGSQGTTGPCARALQVCTGGTWLACNQCDNCPQKTTGQQTICPGGKWPSASVSGKTVASCQEEVKPSVEVCDGKDNDCNGQIDDGLTTVNYYPDKDKDGYGDKSAAPIAKCEGQQPAGYVKDNTDCNDGVKAIHPKATDVCDGIDNNCNNDIDEDAQDLNWYADNDNDGYGVDVRSFIGCKKDASTACTGKNQCRSTQGFVNRRGDCCDKDPDAKPGQTKYFSTKNLCGSFDYNCDRNLQSDPTQKTCQCSTSLQYNIDHQAEVFDDARNQWRLWWLRKLNNQTYTNSTCTLNNTWTAIPSNNFDVDYACRWDGCCGSKIGSYCSNPCKKQCKVSATLTANSVQQTWTPMYNSSTKFLMWRSSSYLKGCLYKSDGTKPTCGEDAKVATDRVSSFPYTKTFSQTKTNSGVLDCTSCSQGENTDKVNYYDRYTYKIVVNNGYFFTTPATQAQKIKCR